VLFIDPEYARVGMNETEARAQGLDYRLLKLPVSLVLRARAVMETRGFLKALVDPKSDQILGFSMLGMNAGEVVAAAHVAMFAGLPYTVFPQIMTSHPTMAEGLKFLFFPELSGSEVKRPTT
jgi:pyruvate/2-oxoglutarate dehydrogenase complex dihydrolipoamide dehydrogenase (E3) component